MGGLILIAFISIAFGVVSGTDCPDRWIAFDGHCYLFGHSERRDFFEAEGVCKRSGGYLVHVDNALENAFIKSELGYLKNDSYWLGLTDYVQEGNWVYYDTNKTRTFEDWSPGEPNSYQGEEDCASFFYLTGYRWADVQCTISLEPVCERMNSDAPVVG